MLSDYEEDVDDDLPSISLSQSTGDKSETEMPPAAEVASERARLAAAEQALRELRAPAPAPPAAAAARPAAALAGADDGEAELLEAWSELRVDEGARGGGGGGGGARGAGERARRLRALHGALPAPSPLFDVYLQAITQHPEAADAITSQVISGIIASLGGGQGGELAAGAWLLGVASTGGGARARRALHALLDHHATTELVDELGVACGAGLAAAGAAALLAAADAARSGAGAGADRLAARLLAAALHHALPPGEETEAPSSLSPDAPALCMVVAERARAAWRRLPAARQLLLLRAAARALAQQPAPAPAAAPAAALLAALAQPLPRTDSRLARQQVLSNVSKLQLLFRDRAGAVGAANGGGGDDQAKEETGSGDGQVKAEVMSGDDHGDRMDEDPAESGEGKVEGELISGDDRVKEELINNGDDLVNSGDAGAAAGAGGGSPSPERKRLRRSPRAHPASPAAPAARK